MNIVFHYYTIGFLARKAGFSERDAEIIAHSSQFVDSNIISYAVRTGNTLFHSIPTQNYGFWDASFPREAYLPFHFVPGNPDYDGAKRKDGRKNPMNCTPGSERAKELLVSGLKTRNPYRVGIALHSYADTWAHQNFTGILEEWNTIDPSSLVPSIGHAQAMKRPDAFTGTWTDPRLETGIDTISNWRRFMKAADRIYRYLCTYNGRPFADAELVLWELEEIVGAEGSGKTDRELAYDFQIQAGFEPYDRSAWLREAFALTEDPGDERFFTGYDKYLFSRLFILYPIWYLLINKSFQVFEN